jgi:ribonuclease D
MLANILDITPKILRKEGQKIVEVIAVAQKLSPDDWPEPLPTPLPRESKDLFDALKTAAKPVAQKTGIPDEVLVRKRHIEKWVLDRVDKGQEAVPPAALLGWRGDLLLPALEPVLTATTQNMQAWQKERQRSVESRK